MIRAAVLSLMLTTPAALAGAPEIVGATAERSGMGWKISVTLMHGDESWENFADGWEVLDMAGNRLGFRELMHPHTPDRPFTRSLPSVMIPDGTRKVQIRARCKADGWGDQVYLLKLK
ncbi:hypothetical protein [Pseudooceanicola onchidii]|uniref:hypothetical protein n=1 Tax=Pseudooceanicola onchidii TaxID=2562279 RepID=UPI0010A9D5D5|nr:hypothetical protein [Pseudooceanicola onchidii]